MLSTFWNDYPKLRHLCMMAATVFISMWMAVGENFISCVQSHNMTLDGTCLAALKVGVIAYLVGAAQKSFLSK